MRKIVRFLLTPVVGALASVAWLVMFVAVMAVVIAGTVVVGTLVGAGWEAMGLGGLVVLVGVAYAEQVAVRRREVRITPPASAGTASLPADASRTPLWTPSNSAG